MPTGRKTSTTTQNSQTPWSKHVFSRHGYITVHIISSTRQSNSWSGCAGGARGQTFIKKDADVYIQIFWLAIFCAQFRCQMPYWFSTNKQDISAWSMWNITCPKGTSSIPKDVRRGGWFVGLVIIILCISMVIIITLGSLDRPQVSV